MWLFQTRGRHCYPICQTQSPSLAPALFKALQSLNDVKLEERVTAILVSSNLQNTKSDLFFC